MEGVERRYAHLESPKGDNLFAAYDPREMKLGRFLIVASSDYLYTPRSLFWPDVIFLTALNFDWGQTVGILISVQRVVNVDPEVVIKAGSNDHLQNRGLLNALVKGSVPSSEAKGRSNHDAALSHGGGCEIDTTEFCKAVNEDNLCAVSRPSPSARNPAVCVCYGRHARPQTFQLRPVIEIEARSG